MVTKPQKTETSLQLRRTLAVPREKVFRAWTEVEEIKKWFCPTGFTVLHADLDLRVGGNYRITMKSPDGKNIDHFGSYREIRPPVKLVFTWILDNQDCAGNQGVTVETLVTVEFQDHGGSTTVVLTHEFFPNEKARDGHQFGWSGCLDHFAEVYG